METQQPSKVSKEIIWIEPRVNELNIKMELDTGSALSIISKTDFAKYFKGLKREKSDITLKTYSGEVINPLGCVQVPVCLKGKEEV